MNEISLRENENKVKIKIRGLTKEFILKKK
jgi:hypothetical protein